MKIFSIIFLSIICSNTIFSQEKVDKNNEIISGGFYITPTQLIFPEIILTYEHFLDNKFSLSYSLGYKIPVGKDTLFEPFGHGLFANYEYQYMFNKYSNAIFFSISPSYYFGQKRKYFIQCELFNRYYWFDNKHISFDNVEMYAYNSIRSEKNNITGIKVLAGTNIKRYIKNPMLLFNIKLYAGFSIRHKSYHYENINAICNDSIGNEIIVPFREENGTEIYPSIQFEIKIGITKKTITNRQVETSCKF